MAIEIIVPRLGWSMDEGTLTEWLKHDGDSVRKGDMLFVLEGDKAAQEVESFDEGILRLLPSGPNPGDPVKVGQLLGYLVADGEVAPFERGSVATNSPAITQGEAVDRPTPSGINRGIGGVDSPFRLGGLRSTGSPQSGASQAQPPATQASRSGPRGPQAQPPTTHASGSGSRGPRATPRARRRAAELGLDWTSLAGTGTGTAGRIREQDVLAALGGDQVDLNAEPVIASSHHVQPHSPIRRTIAKRMVASRQTTVPVTLTTTADATSLLRWRQQSKAEARTADAAVASVTDMIVKLTAIALESFPLLNARWEDAGIVSSAAIHIGIAVDTDAGLLVPVVRNVEQLSLQLLADQSRELISKARTRRLSAKDMQGGTFTVTNLGTFGIDAFTPIIQVPQCAILGIGRIQKFPVFVENRFEPRDVITLSLTFDHRIVDGGPAARFLQVIARAIENPAKHLAE